MQEVDEYESGELVEIKDDPEQAKARQQVSQDEGLLMLASLHAALCCQIVGGMHSSTSHSPAYCCMVATPHSLWRVCSRSVGYTAAAPQA